MTKRLLKSRGGDPHSEGSFTEYTRSDSGHESKHAGRLSGAKQEVQTFSTRLLSETGDFTFRSFGNLPCALVFAVLIFLIDTTLRSSSAKLYYVCGYLINLVFFYTFSCITFPKLPKEPSNENSGRVSVSKRSLVEAMPFQTFTTASFYNFSVGYLLGYWANLNIQKSTPNATLVASYYVAVVFFCFAFSVFYLQACSWQSGVVSVSFGIIGGMVWSQIIMNRIHLDSNYDSQIVMGDNVGKATSGDTRLPNGITACDGKNDDMVCKVFRTGG
jgi:hypothetical protein